MEERELKKIENPLPNLSRIQFGAVLEEVGGNLNHRCWVMYLDKKESGTIVGIRSLSHGPSRDHGLPTCDQIEVYLVAVPHVTDRLFYVHDVDAFPVSDSSSDVLRCFEVGLSALKVGDVCGKDVNDLLGTLRNLIYEMSKSER